MNEDFYDQLKAVFSAPIQAKSADFVDMEEGCYRMIYHINGILERAHKLDLFNDDISLNEMQEKCVAVPLKRYLELEAKPWLKGKLTVGFMGHMNVGKTSALNCIFGENFPVSSNECTALGTYLSYGYNTKKVRVVDKNGGCQVISTEQSAVFDYNVSGGFPFARFFDYIQKENKDSMLMQLSVLDTPGLFSANDAHSEPTINAISLCDVVFWFVKVDGGLTKDTIEFIKERLGDKLLYIIFTFTDAKGTKISEVEEAIVVAIKSAENAELKIQGHFKFGRKDATKDMFREEIHNEFASLVKKNEVYHPIAIVVSLLDTLKTYLLEMINEYNKQKSELSVESDNAYNEFSKSTQNFITSYNRLISSFDNMISTFNNHCSGATFCGNAEGLMATSINQSGTGISNVQKAYQNIDFDKLSFYGALSVQRYELESKLEQMEELRKDLEETLSLFTD